MMMKGRIELFYCVMVVATAVMAGIVKCAVETTCTGCGNRLGR
ncbi:hypothetical protein [Stenotrophomonas maltophilia]